MKTTLITIIATALIIVSGYRIEAKIYRYVDENGKVVFSDTPANNNAIPYKKTTERKTRNIVPEFDTKSYCSEISSHTGGSYQIEEACRDNENNSKRFIATAHISDKTMTYCNEIATIVGGSYSIMEGCIRNEKEAEIRLRKN